MSKNVVIKKTNIKPNPGAPDQAFDLKNIVFFIIEIKVSLSRP